jgi:lipopolysaccharide transport system ATP-binding protein
MESVSRNEGRTVLFVSHQIAAVTRLCQKALWLDLGNVKDFGRADLICSEYLANGSMASAKRFWTERDRAPGNEWVRLESVEAISEEEPADTLEITSPLEIRISYRVLKDGKVLIPNIHLYSDDGTLIFISHDWHSGWRNRTKPSGRYQTTFMVPGNFFSEGRVIVKVAMGSYQPFEVHFQESDVIAFTVVESIGGETSRGDYAGHLPGIVRPLINSRTEIIS